MSLETDATLDEHNAVEELLNEIKHKVDNLMLTDSEASALGWSSPYDEECDQYYGESSTWEQLKPIVEHDRRTAFLQRRKLHFRDQTRKHLISTWITEKAKLTKRFDAMRLSFEIENYLDADRSEELREYLSDVVKSGLKFADKRRKRRRKLEGRWVLYGFTLVRGLAYLAGVVAVFSVADSKYQRVLLAVLLIVGNALLTSRSNDSFTRMELALAIDGQFERLRRFFKMPETELQREVRLGRISSTEKQIASAKVAAYVAQAFEFCVWLLCIAVLIMALWA